MSVTCYTCGQEWARDPRLEVACPVCHAAAGVRCIKPSGHRAWKHEQPHVDREQIALDRGLLAICPGPSARQLDLFGTAHA